MKILLINGSPKGKRSNSLKLAYSFIEGFKNGCTDDEESISIDELHVASMNIAACKGCFACWQKTPGICCIKDDMQKVIGKLIDADLILWSFPLYYFNVPGILKNLIDRQLPMNLPFMSSKQNGYGSGSHDSRYDMEGKRHVLISTCGFYSAVGNYDSVLRMFDHFLGKGNYTTIFCGQGELFRVKELSARTDPSPLISPYSYTFNTNNTCSFPSRFHCRSSFILLHLFHPFHHLDPLPLSTTPTVLNRILISIPIFQFLTYSISSFTTSSKSVISLLPLTCHIPVSPGFTASLPR